jgi:hypothetical protein
LLISSFTLKARKNLPILSLCHPKIWDQKRAIKDKFARTLKDMKTGLAQAPHAYPKKISYGTFACSSSIHTLAFPSEGARQSPRGDNEPPDEIFGPFGKADRLN